VADNTTVDLVVLGGGSGGYAAALRAALASEHAGVQIKTIRGLGYELEVGPRHN